MNPRLDRLRGSNVTRALAAGAAFVSVTASCVTVTEDRTAAELDIGHVMSDDFSVVVRDGHAALRKAGIGHVFLRAGTPSLDIHVELKRPGATFDLEIDNAMPDARCAAVTSFGDALEIATTARERSIDKTCSITIPPDYSDGIIFDVRVVTDDHEDAAPFTFALLSDVQEAIDEVDAIFDHVNKQTGVRFLLFSGDLTRRGTKEQIEAFEGHEKRLQVPLFATLGNHELGADRVYFQDYYGRANYSFGFHDVQFTLLDSGSATLDPRVYEWLDTWLEAARSKVHVVAMHIPPFDPSGLRNGAFANRAEAAKLLERLAEGQVDLTLYGHVHSYYASANAGIPAYISGGGGAIPERLDGIGRHFMKFVVDPTKGVLESSLVRVD